MSGVANLIFGAFLAVSLGQAAWIRLVSGSPEAWRLLGPRLIALLIVMSIMVGVRKVAGGAEKRQAYLVTYSSVAFAAVCLIAVISYAAYYVVISDGDVGWCAIAMLCVVAQGVAMSPIIRAR